MKRKNHKKTRHSRQPVMRALYKEKPYVLEEILNKKVVNSHLLIFDLDGTLVDTDELNFFSYREAIQQVLKIDLALLHDKDRRFTREKLYSTIGDLSDQENQKIIEIKNNVYHKYLHKSKVNEYILRAIDRFSSNNIIVLATCSHRYRAKMVLSYHSLIKYFNYIFYKEDYSNNKFVHVLDHLNVNPSIVVVIENDDYEIEKAILSGIPEKNIVNITKIRGK